MFSVPDGRAANHPFAVTIFSPPIAALLPGALVSLAVMGSPASFSSLTASRDSFCRRVFCSDVAGAIVSAAYGEREYASRVPVGLPGSFFVRAVVFGRRRLIVGASFSAG